MRGASSSYQSFFGPPRKGGNLRKLGTLIGPSLKPLIIRSNVSNILQNTSPEPHTSRGKRGSMIFSVEIGASRVATKLNEDSVTTVLLHPLHKKFELACPIN